MDPTTASYFRALLYRDGQDAKQLPAGLVKLHAWALKSNLALGRGGVISKETAISIVMTWMSSTNEGRAFARQNTNLDDLFDLPGTSQAIDWDLVQPETLVLVEVNGKPTQGVFLKRRGNTVDVKVGTEEKSFRTHLVKLVSSGA